MKKLEIYIAEALGRTSMLPGHSDKRFAKSMSSRARATSPAALSDRQRWLLLKLAVKYRRQMPTGLIERAKEELAKMEAKASSVEKVA